MESAQEQRAILRGVPLFAACSDRGLDEVAALGRRDTLPAGAALTEEGRPGDSVYVMLEGTAEVRRSGATVAELGAGDVVGEISVLTHVARSATVTATSPVSLVVFSGRDFRSLIGRNPPLLRQVLEALVAHA